MSATIPLMTPRTVFDWQQVKRFNFTWAIRDGAWLEDVNGNIDWFTFTKIGQQLGQLWIDRQLKRQGWMTGCWIEVEQRPYDYLKT